MRIVVAHSSAPTERLFAKDHDTQKKAGRSIVVNHSKECAAMAKG